MTDEERQRQIDFILEQQGRFYADLQLMKEAHAEAQANAEKRFNQLERGFVNLSNFIFDTAKLQRENAEQIAELRETLKATNERLDAFIFVLETDIASRSRKNGAAKKSRTKRKPPRNGKK